MARAEPGMSKAEAKAAADKAAAAAAAASSNKRFQQTQAQVDEVVDIMRMNVDKVLERDQKLSQLDDRADALQMGASQFEQSAGALKRKYWWKNLKMMLILGGIVAILAIVVIVWIVNSVKKDEPPYVPQQPAPPAPQIVSVTTPKAVP
ncbi:vesicle-associated membrane 2 [Brachionus plicatilis]|uniref:Vesicle-associated membrane 2 n=1 Tax=Brachionus plicatilis TaxID=10195 RepID=A0A3M7QFS9_BRAPC|nr:vesicle-associated membrane 2 [Brachionus plicatilis]